MPLPQAAKLADGALTTRLKVAFVTEKGVPTTLQAFAAPRASTGFALTRSDGTPLVRRARIDATIGEARSARRTRSRSTRRDRGAERRSRAAPDGVLEIARLMTPRKASAARGAPRARRAAPWTLASPKRRSATARSALADEVDLAGVSRHAHRRHGGRVASFHRQGAAGPRRAGVRLGRRALRRHRATSMSHALAARGHFALTKFSLARLFPYYAYALTLDVKRGSLALAGDFDVAAGATPLQVKLAGARQRCDRRRARRCPTSASRCGACPRRRSPASRSISPRGASPSTASTPRAPRSAPSANRTASSTSRGWCATTCDDGHAAAPAAAAARRDVGVVVQESAQFDRTTSTSRTAVPRRRSSCDLPRSARSARTSAMRAARRARSTFARASAAAGRARAQRAHGPRIPFAIDWRVDATGLDLLPLKALRRIADEHHRDRRGGSATKGALVVGADASGTTHATYAGDVTISDFGALDRPTGQELVRWKTLTLTGVDSGSAPAGSRSARSRSTISLRASS